MRTSGNDYKHTVQQRAVSLLQVLVNKCIDHVVSPRDARRCHDELPRRIGPRLEHSNGRNLRIRDSAHKKHQHRLVRGHGVRFLVRFLFPRVLSLFGVLEPLSFLGIVRRSKSIRTHRLIEIALSLQLLQFAHDRLPSMRPRGRLHQPRTQRGVAAIGIPKGGKGFR